MTNNDLYLTVMPLIDLGSSFGRTYQTLTLFPDRDFATQFFPDEVDGYIAAFKERIRLLTGGHVKGYDVEKEPTDDGRVIVRVVQHVE